MRKYRLLISVMLTSLALSLAACSNQQDAQTESSIQAAEQSQHSEPTVQTAEQHQHTQVPGEPSNTVYEPGSWMNMSLTDPRTRVEFRLSDFRGKVIILEMMDPGCYICKDQLKEVKAALEVVGDKAVAVSVDVGFKGDSAVARWADQNGATWLVASMPREFGQALVNDFGSAITVPSGTPVVIIYPSGEPHATEPGIKTSSTLVDLVNQWTP